MKEEFINHCRARGQALIQASTSVKTQEDWINMWKNRPHPFPFKFGKCWKSTIEYIVDDFPAEVGFFLDVMGFTANAFGPDYAMLMNPDGDFYFSLVPRRKNGSSTPPNAIKIEFMVEDLHDAVKTLRERGIEFEQEPRPYGEDSPLHNAWLRSPHGIAIQLWGMIEQKVKQDG